MIVAILNALIAIPKIGEIFLKLFSQIASWYCSIQTNETLRAISDAAAFAARAKTEEDRFEASERWRDALSHDRFKL